MDDLVLSRRRILRSAMALSGLAATGLLAACGGGGGGAATTAPAAGAATTAAKPAGTAAAGAGTAAAGAGTAATTPAAGAGTAAAKPAGTTAPAAGAGTAAPTTAGVAKPATGTGQRVTVVDHDWIQGTTGQQGDWYDQFIAKFEEQYPNIKIDRQWFPRAEMHQKLVQLAATGQIGDTVRINVAPLVSELQIKGVLHDLDTLYKGDQEWVNNDQKQFWPGNLRTYTREGKLWGLPVVGHPGCVQYFTNTTMVQQAGLKMPPADGNWSHEDLVTLAKGLTKSEGGRTTTYGVLPCIGNEGIVGFLRAYGGDLFDADGKKCLLNTPESKAGLKALADLYLTHKVAYPWEATLNATELFQGQKVGMAILTSGNARGWPDQISKLPQPFEMEVYANPLGPTGKHATQVSSDGKGVSKSTKNPAEAWTVLSRLFTSRAHGFERHANGLGSPGSRYDIWSSPEFARVTPKLQNIAKVLVLPPAAEMQAWHHPANGRFFETETVLVQEFSKVILGQETDVDRAADNITRLIQDIMDKPPV